MAVEECVMSRNVSLFLVSDSRSVPLAPMEKSALEMGYVISQSILVGLL